MRSSNSPYDFPGSETWLAFVWGRQAGHCLEFEFSHTYVESNMVSPSWIKTRSKETRDTIAAFGPFNVQGRTATAIAV